MSLQATSAYSLAPGQGFASNWNPVCHITYNRDTWVKLLQPPSDYADDEAKLLCQTSSNTWIAWVPNYGEVILEQSEFYA